MNKDHIKSFVKNVDTQLFEIINNLICSICQELFNKPVTTPCGHSFCNGCIKRVLSSKDNSGCPLCKNSVKRYGLLTHEVKSTLTKICQELPTAFKKDVKDLTSNNSGLEDLLKTTKLCQFNNQDIVKQVKANKRKSTTNQKSKKPRKPVLVENNSESFIPVLKRSKNVIEYGSAKKKKLDDLVSVSQTEPASHSSSADSSELDKKLQNIEKIPLEKKVNEWFNAVGDNIYINSPSSSILGTDNKNESDEPKVEKEKSTMIRRDYNKPQSASKSETGVSVPLDPYEFVPSQNNNIIKRKRQKKSNGKKIPDFKALQSFTKESVKRHNILLDNSKEEADADEEERKYPPAQMQFTASQKFEKLLSETKEEPKKSHVLYSASQSSSTQFLDVSFNSKVAESFKKKRTKGQKKLLEDVLFKNVEVAPEEKSRETGRTKRKRSAENAKSGQKTKFAKVIELNTDEASPLENSIGNYLMRAQRKKDLPPTKLEGLLKELLDDDIIYATRPTNAPVRLPELDVVTLDSDTQKYPAAVTQMIGFCTQEETPDQRYFKEMVRNMEDELNASSYTNEELKEKLEIVQETVKKQPEVVNKATKKKSEIVQEVTSKQPEIVREVVHETIKKKSEFIHQATKKMFVGVPIFTEEQNNSCDEETRFSESPVVKFLHLGKLTPLRKRTKTSVVKLVFPIGLSSLARRSALKNNLRAQERNSKCQVSTGIQTSQETVSACIQTSQVPQCSFNMQTTQGLGTSVEIQTTQKLTTSAQIQTTESFVSQEIQTTQIGYESVEVQTTQRELFQNATDLVETPVRKPSHLHRKIVTKKTTPKSCSNLQETGDKDLIEDFEVEGFEDSWHNTEIHKQLVEIKNKKNKEQNKMAINMQTKAGDVESDDDSDSDSDIQPPKRRNSLKIFSQDSVPEILENFEERQKIPLNVHKVNLDEELEVIDLDTPASQNSEEQMMKVLKNIDMDLPKGKSVARGEKSEESDSDFFVEQTPPRPTSRIVEDERNSSLSLSLLSPDQKQPKPKENSEGTDLIGDSIPKGFSESFLLSLPQKLPPSLEKNAESQKKTPKFETTLKLPDENDQNQLNALGSRTTQAHQVDAKTLQLKTVVDAWKQTEISSPPAKPPCQKKICIVASSVKNPDLIKKFANKFNIEYLNKPTKEMTHLIVGLHENEDNEVLPHCTPKLLFALANKKWVVSELWAESCLKINSILPEETFETLDPVGGDACKKARLSSDQLLKHCEIYLLGEFQMISKEEFSELIVDCGGSLVSSPDKFSFLPSKLRMIIADRDCVHLNEKQLQDMYLKYSTVVVSRDVVIMSIQSYTIVNLQPYLLHPASEERLVKLGYPLSLVRDEEDDEEIEEEGSVAR